MIYTGYYVSGSYIRGGNTPYMIDGGYIHGPGTSGQYYIRDNRIYALSGQYTKYEIRSDGSIYGPYRTLPWM